MGMLQHVNEGDNNMDIGESANGINIEMTEKDEESVQRLIELGFDKSLVTQVYFACNKDEQITANYLFDMGQ